MLDYICGQIRGADSVSVCVCVAVCVRVCPHLVMPLLEWNGRRKLMLMVVNTDEITHLDASFDTLDMTSSTESLTSNGTAVGWRHTLKEPYLQCYI